MDQRMSTSDLYQRGLVLKKAHMYYLAIEDFRHAAHDPQCAAQAYVQIALCLKAVDRPDEAVQAFRQAAASPVLSADEQLQIFYHMGRTLESSGRYAESIEVYGLIRREKPGFGDVTQRIKHLCAGGRGPVPSAQGVWQGWMDAVLAGGRALTPPVIRFFEETGRWLSRRTGRVSGSQERPYDQAGSRGSGQRVQSGGAAHGRAQAAVRKRTIEHRRCPRVPIRLRSYFSAKGRMVAGKGELRDLSPWGCRMTSAVAVPIGEDLQCCIFPHNSNDAFVIEGATVCWISPKEFGLSFTDVNPAVREQLMQLCRAAA